MSPAKRVGELSPAERIPTFAQFTILADLKQKRAPVPDHRPHAFAVLRDLGWIEESPLNVGHYAITVLGRAAVVRYLRHVTALKAKRAKRVSLAAHRARVGQ